MSNHHEQQAEQERQLIEAIKAKPGHQVFPSQNGGSVHVVRASTNRIAQISVWLGRPGTVARLKEILAAQTTFEEWLRSTGRCWNHLNTTEKNAAAREFKELKAAA